MILLIIVNEIDGSTLMCMEDYPPFLPRVFKYEVQVGKLCKDLTGNELRVRLQIPDISILLKHNLLSFKEN